MIFLKKKTNETDEMQNCFCQEYFFLLSRTDEMKKSACFNNFKLKFNAVIVIDIIYENLYK